MPQPSPEAAGDTGDKASASDLSEGTLPSMSKRHLSQQQQRRIRAAQARSLRDAETSLDGAEPGLVVARYGKRALIEDSAGERWQCELRSNIDGLVAGDYVVWRKSGHGGVIEARNERQSVLCRPDARGKLRPVAANIDMMIVVLAPSPEPHRHLIDRYLVAAHHIGVDVALILNKTDLLDEGSDVPELLDNYRQLGYTTGTTNGRVDPTANALRPLVQGRTIVLVGQSGVGKSSLIQRLIPDLAIRIGELSLAIDKGRHTTTAAELYHLPEGGRLIDSPGIREFHLHHLPAPSVAAGFIEFQPYLGHCKFRDCQHDKEVGCALKAALDEGDISGVRFESYRRIVDAPVP